MCIRDRYFLDYPHHSLHQKMLENPQQFFENDIVLNQIFCQKMKPTSSHIRRNVCRSVEDWVHHNERTLLTIGAMNSVDYSVFARTRD